MAYVSADCIEYDKEYLLWREDFQKTHCKIVNTGTFIRASYVDEEYKILDTYTFCDEATLKKSYKHINYTKTGEDGKPKTVTCINAWITDINIRRYDSFEMIPLPLPCPSSVFNLWRPSPFYEQDITPSSDSWNQSAVDKFLAQVDVLCNNEKDTADYVVRWMSHLIQKPYEKSTHLCFTSIQGTGKSLTFSVLKKIIGGGSFESATPGRDVWGQFNGKLLDNILVILSEVNHKSQAKGAEAKFKALITDDLVPVNQKNIKLAVVKSYHRFVTLTNEPDPIQLTKDDRRHMLVLCSPEKKKDLQYFVDFDAEFCQHNSLLTLYSYLNNLDISKWNARNIPKTKYHLKLLKLNRDPIDEFFEWWVIRQILTDTMIESGENAGCVKAFGREVLQDYEIYRSNNGNLPSKDTGSLCTYIMTKLQLPEEAIKLGPRTKSAQSRFYNIDILKEHYRIGRVVVSPPSLPGRAESADVLIGGSPWKSPVEIEPIQLFATEPPQLFATETDNDTGLKNLNSAGEEEEEGDCVKSNSIENVDDDYSSLSISDFCSDFQNLNTEEITIKKESEKDNDLFGDGLGDLNTEGESEKIISCEEDIESSSVKGDYDSSDKKSI